MYEERLMNGKWYALFTNFSPLFSNKIIAIITAKPATQRRRSQGDSLTFQHFI
jgi:hypothetical protein